MQLSSRISGIVEGGSDGWGLYYAAQRRQAEGAPVVMLTIGDHDVPTDPRILSAMETSARGGNLGYTNVNGTLGLRRAIAARAERLGSTPTAEHHVIPTTGGQGALFATMTAVLDPGQSCVVLDPYYTSFLTTVRAVSARPIPVPCRAEDGFQPDIPAIEAAVQPDTRAILINTPNNPTGAVYRRDRLEALADLCQRRDLWLISDELYDSQIHDGRHLSPRDLPGMAERTLVIGSMSKAYAMTGCRVGWAIGPEQAIERIGDLAGATTYGLPGFLQDAAEMALRDLPELEVEIAERYHRRRDGALEALGRTNALRVSPPEGGMYLMLDVRPTGLSGTGFAERLLAETDIAVMPGESFGTAAAGHIRIAMTVSDEHLNGAMTRIAGFAEGL